MDILALHNCLIFNAFHGLKQTNDFLQFNDLFPRTVTQITYCRTLKGRQSVEKKINKIDRKTFRWKVSTQMSMAITFEQISFNKDQHQTVRFIFTKDLN